MELTRAAKAFCARQAKQMVVRNIETVSIVFSCEATRREI